jgi:hypothetical protein
MHAHVAEIVAEARLHKGTRHNIEWLAGRLQYLVDDWRRGVGRVSMHRSGLQDALTIPVARFTFAPDAGVLAAGAGALHCWSGSRGDNLRCHTLDLLLVDILRLAHGEIRLNHARTKQALDG